MFFAKHGELVRGRLDRVEGQAPAARSRGAPSADGPSSRAWPSSSSIVPGGGTAPSVRRGRDLGRRPAGVGGSRTRVDWPVSTAGVRPDRRTRRAGGQSSNHGLPPRAGALTISFCRARTSPLAGPHRIDPDERRPDGWREPAGIQGGQDAVGGNRSRGMSRARRSTGTRRPRGPRRCAPAGPPWRPRPSGGGRRAAGAPPAPRSGRSQRVPP